MSIFSMQSLHFRNEVEYLLRCVLHGGKYVTLTDRKMLSFKIDLSVQTFLKYLISEN